MTNRFNTSSNMHVATYIHYSSNMQDDNFTLDAQLRQIKARAAADGVVIIKVYSDPAISAYTERCRLGIVEMLKVAHKGESGILYAHKVDRLAHPLEWAIDIAEQIGKDGIVLKAVEQNFDVLTPESKLMFHLLGSLGEFYSDNLSKETHKGKYERAKKDYNNGWFPCGYKSEAVENRKLATPDPDLVPVVRQTYERYATGLYYDQDIADWLNSQGFRTRFGRQFTKDAIRDILQNPFYKENIHYHGQYARGGKIRRRTEAETVKGLHSPIIDEDLFEKCQRVRAARRRQPNSNQIARSVHLLSGIVTCKHCGRRLRAQSSPYKRYYREASRFGRVDCAFAGKSGRADEIDPNKGKARLRGEMRRMSEGYKRGLYDGDEHTFWREIESLQMQLNAIE